MSTRVTAELPYERGQVLRSTADDVAKLRAAWQIVARRHADGSLYDFTGLVRSLALPEGAPLDDELAPALFGERLTGLGLEHLGGVLGRDDVFVANRTTAGLVAAMQVLVRPGATVLGFSAGYSHPAVGRAVRLAGGTLVDVRDTSELAERIDAAALLVLTRLAVTYEALPLEEILRATKLAREAKVPVFVDDAGGARVGPAVFEQPRTLELDVDAGVTGLDKYGTSGPRLGLLGGRAELVARIRARAIELGLDARPMLFPAVVESLERYRPERVRELVATTAGLAEALVARLGDWPVRTPVAVKLEGQDVLAELERRGASDIGLVPIEATAGLAMLLLRDHGILTVHFAALPPGTSALLLKFIPPETLERFGGAERFAEAVDASLDQLAALTSDEELRALLGL
jgi:L-seryl-tRNA(Ser) seleniumtransferase